MLNVITLATALMADLEVDTVTGISNVLVEMPDGTLLDLVETYNVYGATIHHRSAGSAVVLKVQDWKDND